MDPLLAVDAEVLNPRVVAALLEGSATVNSSLNLDSTLQAIARMAAKVMDAEASSVLLYDPVRKKLIFRAVHGAAEDVLLGEEFDADRGIAGKVLATSEGVIVPDVRKDSDFYPKIDERSHVTTRNMIAAPMIHKGVVVGVVEVLNSETSPYFKPSDLTVLQIFANLAAIGVANAQEHEVVVRENIGLRESLDPGDQVIGHSPAFRSVLDLVARVAGSNATVLLLGETGTGKEMTARLLHRNSQRRERSFVAVNCAALPETLLESELFGHERGSFTGAVDTKIGRFEMAEGGTIFLDEIGDISQSTQVKLLRVLQEREFVRVGGVKTISCDVRVIAATNRNLQEGMKSGEFREDLFYRLNVFPIQLPPLRQRKEDIPLLVEQFADRSARELGRTKPKISSDVMALLVGYAWPGNIRELQNVMDRAVLMSDGRDLRLDHLPREITGDAAAGAESAATEGGLRDYEKALIIRALEENNWNQSRAAASLKISRDNLRYRVKKYKIVRPGK